MSDLLVLNRKIYTDKSTIGDLYLGGDFFCATLELSCRRANDEGKLAIPASRYQVKFDFSPHFNREMPFLFNNFIGRSGTKRPDGTDWLRTDVMFHTGNFPSDVEGCIVVGVHDDGMAPDFIGSSRVTFEKLYTVLKATTDDIWLTITGGIRV